MSGQLIIIPKPDERASSAWHQEWFRRMEERWNPPFEIPNIQFHYYHDDFFNRHLSIRAARDWKNHPFWFYVAMLFMLGQLGFAGLGLTFKWLSPFIPYLPTVT